MSDGFFRLAGDGTLQHAPSFVIHLDYQLRRERHAEYSYPIHGWRWFDSVAEAEAFFGVEAAVM